VPLHVSFLESLPFRATPIALGRRNLVRHSGHDVALNFCRDVSGDNAEEELLLMLLLALQADPRLHAGARPLGRVLSGGRRHPLEVEPDRVATGQQEGVCDQL